MNKKTKDILLYALGGTVVLMALVIIIGLFKVEVYDSNKDLFNISAGIILGSFTQVVSFFFGSSQGSKDKTEKMATNTTNI